MDRRPPPKWVPPGQGEPDLDHRKLREELEKTSSLPSGTYGPAMPDVETELLLDQGVRSLLGRLLAGPRIEPTTQDSVGEFHEEPVDPDNIHRFLSEFLNSPDEEPPDLMAGLRLERLWVLIDLATKGEGLSRQRATHELRDAMKDLLCWEGVDEEILSDLVQLLGEARNRGDMPLVLHTLDLAARRSLKSKKPKGDGKTS